MCLIARSNKAKRAEKDIVCYKYASQTTRYENMYLSPCKGYSYILGNEYKEPSFKPVIKETHARMDSRGLLYEIEKGFHSIKTRYAADGLSIVWKPVTSGVLLKCIIPAGALYYEGEDPDQPYYCSERIKIVAVEKQ